MLLSHFFYKVGWGRVFMELSRVLLAFVLEKIHLSSTPGCGEGVVGGALSNCAGGNRQQYKVRLDMCFGSLQGVHAL